MLCHFLLINFNGFGKLSATNKEGPMANMSAGKQGAMKHNSGNMSDNKKKGAEAGRKNSRH